MIGPNKRGNINRLRWRLFNLMCDEHIPDIGPAGFALWAVLFRHAGKDGRARVSQGRLTGQTGLSIPTIKKHMRRLQDAGLVTVERRGVPGRLAVYRLASPRELCEPEGKTNV